MWHPNRSIIFCLYIYGLLFAYFMTFPQGRGRMGQCFWPKRPWNFQINGKDFAMSSIVGASPQPGATHPHSMTCCQPHATVVDAVLCAAFQRRDTVARVDSHNQLWPFNHDTVDVVYLNHYSTASTSKSKAWLGIVPSYPRARGNVPTMLSWMYLLIVFLLRVPPWPAPWTPPWPVQSPVWLIRRLPLAMPSLWLREWLWAHGPGHEQPCASSCSVCQSAPGVMFSSLSSPEKGGYQHLSHPLRRWEQPLDSAWLFGALACCLLLLPPLPGPVATTRPQTQDEEYHWIYFVGTCNAPAGQGFDQQPQHWCTLLLSLLRGWRVSWQRLAHRPGRRGLSSWCGHQPCTHSFSKTSARIESELGPTDKEAPKKGKQLQ